MEARTVKEINTQLFKQLEASYPFLTIIRQCSKELKIPVYLIGGFVRDFLIHRPCKDIDLTCVGSGLEVAKHFHKLCIEQGYIVSKDVVIFKRFGTAMVRFNNEYDIDFVGARKESYSLDSRNPSVETGSLEDDLKRRDFTINTLGINLSDNNYGALIDVFNGIKDLKQGIITTPLNPDIAFSDDPLRMLRAIRFSTQLDYTIDNSTLESIIRNNHRMSIISKERITEELNKIITSPIPSKGFKLLDKVGLLPLIFPQMSDLKGIEIIDGKGHKDNFYHTLEVLDNVAKVSTNLWLRWSAILHDIAKPATKRFDPKIGWTFHGHEEIGARMVKPIFRSMRLPLNHHLKYVEKLVRLHLRPIALVNRTVTDSAIRRLLTDAGDDIDELMLLCNADITSKNLAKKKQYKNNFNLVKEKLTLIEEKDHLRNFQPPISGVLIIKTFNLTPCKLIGEIKKRIKEAILEGEIQNNYQEAYQYMLIVGKEMNLSPHNTLP